MFHLTLVLLYNQNRGYQKHLLFRLVRSIPVWKLRFSIQTTIWLSTSCYRNFCKSFLPLLLKNWFFQYLTWCGGKTIICMIKTYFCSFLSVYIVFDSTLALLDSQWFSPLCFSHLTIKKNPAINNNVHIFNTNSFYCHKKHLSQRRSDCTSVSQSWTTNCSSKYPWQLFNKTFNQTTQPIVHIQKEWNRFFRKRCITHQLLENIITLPRATKQNWLR